MKERTKGFITGFLVCVLLVGAAVPAAAAVYDKVVSIYYRDVKVRLDGDEIILKDAQGRRIEPFLMDGTTYLPLRGVSSALDLDVKWDGSTKTVDLFTEYAGKGLDWDSFYSLVANKVHTCKYVLSDGPEYQPFIGEYNTSFLQDGSVYVRHWDGDYQYVSGFRGEWYVEDGYLNIVYEDPFYDGNVRDIYKVKKNNGGFSVEYVSGQGILVPSGEVDKRSTAEFKKDETKTQYDIRMAVESYLQDKGEIE